MRRASGPRAVLAVGVVLGTVLIGPEPSGAQSGVYKSGVELVPLTVTVTDRAGHYVPNLTADDFAILDEGRRQVISHFATSHVPVDLGILLDTSGSMRDSLALAQRAACGLVRQLREGDRGAVAGIASTVLLHQSMTPDLGRVEAALRSTQANGDTALQPPPTIESLPASGGPVVANATTKGSGSYTPRTDGGTRSDRAGGRAGSRRWSVGAAPECDAGALSPGAVPAASVRAQ
jgi:VWFA-related protein